MSDRKLFDQPNQTTSMICIDQKGKTSGATGEFCHLKSVQEDESDGQVVLAEFLAKFELINRGKLAGDRDSITKFIKRWTDTKSPALEAKISDHQWRMLTSSETADGATCLLSIDISEQKARQSLSEFILENHPMPIWANDTSNGKVLYSNPAANLIYNNSPQAHEENRIGDFFVDKDFSRDMLELLKQEGSIDNYDVQTRNENGDEIWVSSCAKLTRLADQEMVISSIQNITDRKLVEDAERRGKTLLRDAIESLSEGFALFAEDHRLIMANQRYAEIHHLISDLIQPGASFEKLVQSMAERGGYANNPWTTGEWISKRLDDVENFAKDVEVNHADGRSYLASIHGTKLGGFVVTLTDMTEKMLAEAQQKEGDFLVRTVLDASSAIVVMAKADGGEILYRSSAALEFFGNTSSAVEHYVDPKDREKLVELMRSKGQVDDYPMLFRSHGREVAASASSRFADFNGTEVVVTNIVDLTEQQRSRELLQQILEACQVPIQMTSVETGEILFSTSETKALFGDVKTSLDYFLDPGDRQNIIRELREKGWFKNRVAKYRGANGREFWNSQSARLLEFDGQEVIVSNTRDLTEELALQEELKNQQEQLFQNDKMSAMGELLAGVAHELNNPLSVVVGHSLMLLEETQDPELETRISKISRSAERCSKIVKTFLAMARQKPAEMASTDINGVVKAAVDLVGYGASSQRIDLACNLQSDLPSIPADFDQIVQVIINLVINAEQAMTNSDVGDSVTISTSSVAEQDEQDWIVVTIEDNGPGIPEEFRARIFEPFFTTKAEREGTGIGLAFCYRTVRSHNGQIWLDPEMTDGSRFIIRLPIVPIEATEELVENNDSIGHLNLKALVVDDEVNVAELISEMLNNEGVRVDISHTAEAAMKQVSHNDYDIILSDINMPGLGGQALFDHLKQNNPDLLSGMAFITGDTLGQKSTSLLRRSQLPYLEKPVTPKSVRDLILTILNADK